MEMKFNTKVCTSRQQSQKLLEIGLKRETADMVYQPHYTKCGTLKNYYEPTILKGNMRKFVINNDVDFKDYIPAWSLNRLLDIYIPISDPSMWSLKDVNFDKLIQCIRMAIINGNFPNEFLYESKEI
jgi:hypothetical protein